MGIKGFLRALDKRGLELTVLLGMAGICLFGIQKGLRGTREKEKKALEEDLKTIYRARVVQFADVNHDRIVTESEEYNFLLKACRERGRDMTDVVLGPRNELGIPTVTTPDGKEYSREDLKFWLDHYPHQNPSNFNTSSNIYSTTLSREKVLK